MNVKYNEIILKDYQYESTIQKLIKTNIGMLLKCQNLDIMMEFKYIIICNNCNIKIVVENILLYDIYLCNMYARENFYIKAKWRIN